MLEPKSPTRSRRLRAAGAAALCLGLAQAVAADPPPVSAAGPAFRPLVSPAERTDPVPPAWLGENVHYKKGTGFEYRTELEMGDRPLVLGVQGPVVRKKKRLGLTFEVRF